MSETTTTENKLIPFMTGYKATDANMTCSGSNNGVHYSHTFEVGVWYECEGEPILCKNGFHFCQQPSGPWAYYSAEGTRVWKIEAEQVVDVPFEPGSDFKRVAKRIRLVKEIHPDGDHNTGYLNTGDRNTGDHNTGNRNTGYGNTGYRNTGDHNTGDHNTGNRNTGNHNTGNRNTGYRNTGDGNTGDYNTGNRNTGNYNTGDGNTGNRNTGYGNTGDYNTGYRNTGDGNTGDYNTGNRNTGNGNTGDYHSGFFNSTPEFVRCFDELTHLTHSQFVDAYPEYRKLCDLLHSTDSIKFDDWKHLPGITEEKLKSLHEKHLGAKKKS